MDVGDRVYHKGAQGNGIIRSIHPSFNRDRYGVEFFWEKYKQQDLHNLGGRLDAPMGRWCSEDSLVLQEKAEQRNRVSMVGGRSLDNLIRKVCEIPRRHPRDGSDIVINYGKPHHRVPSNIFMVNRTLMSNKYQQVMMMHNDGVSVPESRRSLRGPIMTGNPWLWMAKPYTSIGGRDMYRINLQTLGVEQNPNWNTHYAQRIIPKVREFRAHVFLWNNPQVLLIQEKHIDNRDQLCWNKEQGGVFRHPYQPMLGRNRMLREEGDLVDRICTIACHSCRAVRYDFGGVDIGIDNTGTLYVFEVNSRMGVREKTLAAYKRAFWALESIDINDYNRRRWQSV